MERPPKDMDMCDNAQCKAKDTCARYVIYQSMKGMYAPFVWVMTAQENIDKCAAYSTAKQTPKTYNYE